MNIVFIPIDDRPVCYGLPKLITDIDKSLNIFMPERNLLGNLNKRADVEQIFKWLENLRDIDAIVLSLDTVAYGGLISSRRCNDSFDEIKIRIRKLYDILTRKNADIYAFSSIMRISNNNINEEEKEYWSKWGKKIFDYSYRSHKNGCKSRIANTIPSDILEDYVLTRKRNFEINKIYLEWQKQGFFKTLIFSKDDCAEYGFNVREAQALQDMGGFVKTGADEIPLTLLARAIKGEVKIFPIYAQPECKNLISNYEDISIQKSTESQIELAGCKVVNSDKEADIILYVNNFIDKQGEIVMKISTKPFHSKWNIPEKPYMIADVRFANGSDNCFIKELFKAGTGENFYGYAGWNTSANTLGSLICAAKIKFLAKKYDETAFKKLETVRFLDDWAYQANVRQQIKTPNETAVKEKMHNYEKEISEILNYKFNTKYCFPWKRLFEIEVVLS